MHEQFSQDIQAVRDQHKDVRNNHKKEMKEAEKKNARMITMLDKVIECQDNQMRHHEVERKQERELREKEVKELREVEARKEVEVEEMKAEHDAKAKLREKEAKEMRDKVFKLEEDNRALQCQVERLRMDPNQT